VWRGRKWPILADGFGGHVTLGDKTLHNRRRFYRIAAIFRGLEVVGRRSGVGLGVLAIGHWELWLAGFGGGGFFGGEDDAVFEAEGDGGGGEPISGLGLARAGVLREPRRPVRDWARTESADCAIAKSGALPVRLASRTPEHLSGPLMSPPGAVSESQVVPLCVSHFPTLLPTIEVAVARQKNRLEKKPASRIS
jgi:hypothetical protein